MPEYVANRLCPTLKTEKRDFPKYNHFGKNVIRILSVFVKEVETYGFDEGCLVFGRVKFNTAVNKLMENINLEHKKICSISMIYLMLLTLQIFIFQ